MSPLLAILAFQAATVDPAADPLFAKPITLRMPMATVREVASALTKATGQSVDASGTVNDWKATVLVKELPAGRVMEAVADALGLVWKKDGSTFRLTRPDGAVGAEASYLQSEAKLAETNPIHAAGDGGFDPPQNIPRRTLPGVRTTRGRGNPSGVVASRFDPYLLATETANGQPPSRLSISQPLGESEYAKAIRTWASVPAEPGELWSLAVPPSMPVAKSTWENGSYTLSDVLAAWFDVTHLPVVADAFRISMRGNMINTGPALSVLQSYAGSESLSFKFANGVARLRHPAFWRLRGQEIPESIWNTIEKGSASLDNLAAFAGRLSAPQAASFRSLEAPLSHITTQSLREAYPALLLWNGLPSQVRTALYKGTPVGLSAVQRVANTYAWALREAPYYNAGNPTEALATNPAKLGIFGTAGNKSFELRLSNDPGRGVSYEIALP